MSLVNLAAFHEYKCIKKKARSTNYDTKIIGIPTNANISVSTIVDVGDKSLCP